MEPLNRCLFNTNGICDTTQEECDKHCIHTDYDKKIQELNTTWDDKFGIIDKGCTFQTSDKKCGHTMPDSLINCGYTGDETNCPAYTPKHKVIEGVGRDAEITVNAAGGKQSKTSMAMHLVDPDYLIEVFGNLAEKCEYLDEGDSTCVEPDDFERHNCYQAIVYIARYMRSGVEFELTRAMDALCLDEILQVMRIAEVLQYGADRYEPNNWRLIPQQDHINHALIHIIAHLKGDTQDDHINHALCRLMMAKLTECSKDFSYTEYKGELK